MRTEMTTLIDKLVIANIPHEVTIQPYTNTLQVWYPSRDGAVCDVICHEFSYGGTKGLLEIMGLVDDGIDDDVEGYLTAVDVFARIYTHYMNH